MEPVICLQDLDVNPAWLSDQGASAAPAIRFVPASKADEQAEKYARALVTINQSVDAACLDRYPALQVVAVAFTGYDAVDLDACRARNIAVCNVPAYSTDSVAELVLGMAISWLRQIPLGDSAMRAGRWPGVGPGQELAGLTVGVVGTGHIGLRVAQLFAAFRCNLLGWSRTQKPAFTDLGGKYVDDLKTLLAESNIVTLHVPSTPDTRHLIGEKELAAMKPDALLINTARGAIIDQGALYSTLRDARIGGAALDVYETEPVKQKDPLLDLRNSILMPHGGFRTTQALQRRAAVTIDNITAALNGEPINRVS